MKGRQSKYLYYPRKEVDISKPRKQLLKVSQFLPLKIKQVEFL